LYNANLIQLIQDHSLHPHLLADDTQIYGFCRSSTSLEPQKVITNCLDDVAKWMHSNWLQLNTAKTEILWSTTGRRLHLLPKSPLRVGTDAKAKTFPPRPRPCGCCTCMLCSHSRCHKTVCHFLF